MGYSVGRWEGDTLVVETIGFKDTTWLDFGGHPHTEELRMTERFRRRDFGHMDLQVTLDDPAVYAKPLTLNAGGTLAADTELIEYVCLENEKDRVHLVGPDDRGEGRHGRAGRCWRHTSACTGAVTPRAPGSWRAQPVESFTVTLEEGQLLIDLRGKGKVRMVPLSQTMFSPRLLGTYEFVKDGNGRVTHMLVHSAEEVLTAVRQP